MGLFEKENVKIERKTNDNYIKMKKKERKEEKKKEEINKERKKGRKKERKKKRQNETFILFEHIKIKYSKI